MSALVPPAFEIMPDPGAQFGAASSWFDLIGPIYRQPGTPGRTTIGFAAADKHTNYLRQTHGGMLAAFMDYVLYFAAQSVQEDSSFVTLTMSLNYIAPAPLDAWIEGAGEVIRAGRQIVFVQGRAQAGDALLVQATGAFRRIERRAP